MLHAQDQQKCDRAAPANAKLLEKLQYLTNKKMLEGFNTDHWSCVHNVVQLLRRYSGCFGKKTIAWSPLFWVKLGGWVFWRLNEPNVAQQKSGIRSYQERLLGEILSLFKAPEWLCVLEYVTKSCWIVNWWIITKKIGWNECKCNVMFCLFLNESCAL